MTRLPKSPVRRILLGLAASLLAFGKNSETLAKALTQFPKTLDVQGRHTVEVLLNGAAVLQGIMPSVKDLIEAQVNKSIKDMLKTRFPEVA